MKKATKSAFSVFLQGSRAPEEDAAPAAAPDPAERLLAALADVPLALPELAERAGFSTTALIEGLRPLEELRLVRRLEPEEPDGAMRFALTSGGRAMLARTARG